LLIPNKPKTHIHKNPVKINVIKNFMKVDLFFSYLCSTNDVDVHHIMQKISNFSSIDSIKLSLLPLCKSIGKKRLSAE